MSTEPGKQPQDRPGMVDWYAPVELVKIGIRTLVSVMLGERLDSRLISPNGTDDESIFDLSDCETLTFDYTADTGDGWDPTYTLAYQMTKPEKQADGSEYRSDFLILGGDEVYPVASRDAYADRLVSPYRVAAEKLGLANDPKHLNDMFLIPGNHDWYDSLASFTRRFCCNRWIGAYRTRQKRSYFILKLPHDWHIFATDIQLGHDIDATQFQFFKSYAETLTPLDRVILLTAEPGVVYGKQADLELRKTMKSMEYIVEKSGARVPLRIAGDVHNYQRYQRQRTPHVDSWPEGPYTQTQLVSGGGGAFLHPTHAFESDPDNGGGFELKNRYPAPETSEKLGHKNRRFALDHLPMNSFFGVLFMLMFWTLSPQDSFSFVAFPIEHPVVTLAGLSVILGTYLFATADSPKSGGETRFSHIDRDTRRKARAAGLLHGLALLIIALLAWRVSHAFAALLPPDPQSLLGLYLPRALHLVIAGFAAATVFGWYLEFTLKHLGLHRNEAFSALAHPHHKHFLRIKITPEGPLLIRALALPETAGANAQDKVRVEEIEAVEIS
ncbi:MAG: hypothetical protein ACWA5X_05005 [bacterium]